MNKGSLVPKFVNLSEASYYLERYYQNTRGDRGYTLDNMRQLMALLGDPQDALKVVHVAGTSGKTSTAYYISALLAGTSKVGLTVSPHINQLNERVQINGQPISETDFCNALSEFLNKIESSNVKPTWFEVLVAFAYWYFDKVKVDYAVIEVGLGGLKDGTNIVTSGDKVCVITDIGYDHVNVLGNSLAEIAAQKAGIILPRNQVFSHEQSPEIIQVLTNAASGQNANLKIIKDKPNDTDMPDYQFRNWTLAYEAYKFIAKRDELPKLSEGKIKNSQATQVPGRMDVRGKNGKTIILDGAHNAQKITTMISSFKKLYPNQKPAVLISLKQGKDYQQAVPLISDLASRVIITEFRLAQDVPVHSMPVDELKEAFKSAGFENVSIESDQVKAIDKLLAGPEKICLVTGSLYLLGQLRNNGLV